MKAAKDKELALLAKAGSEFAAKILAPIREESDNFPFGPLFTDALAQAFDLGFFHTALPEDMEGLGAAMSPLCSLLENIARDDASLSAIILSNAFAQNLLLEAGQTELLRGICADSRNFSDILIGFPIFCDPTETPPALSAKKEGDGWILKGAAPYVVLGGLAKRVLVPALIEKKELGFFLAGVDPAGVSVSEPVFSLGIHACPAFDLEFKNAKAVAAGVPGKAGELFERAAGRMHLAAAAILSGIMKGSVREALDYGKKRFQGGKPIIRWSEMRMILGGMSQKSRIAEMALAEACRLYDSGDHRKGSAGLAAFIHCAETAMEVTTDGVQALGGVGYMKDFGQEKRFRDAQHMSAAFGILPKKKLRYLQKAMLGE